MGMMIAQRTIGVTVWGPRFLSLEDLTGTFEAVLFPKCYRRFAGQTLTAGPYRLRGRIEEEQGVCSLNVEKLEVVGKTFTGPASSGGKGRPRFRPGASVRAP
jgi:DNA polymerase III alpha subunit